jgi:pyruvate formate lyase activating enzyme
MSVTVQCEICPRQCVIAPGESGDCRIRVNLDGQLIAVTYGYPCSLNVDPVEKKPVFHFRPGTATLSLATVGCNLHCKNCQNWEISQQAPESVPAGELPPEQLPALAQRSGCPSVSYTYTDPVVYYEYTLDGCRAARAQGLQNILVTAGYINRQPARELFAAADVARIDLKSMSDSFYRDICGATLKPVLNTLALAREMGLHLEIVHLIIPTLNDRDEDLTALCRWLRTNLGADIPLHLSRFFPQHRMQHLPPTPVETLRRARAIARAEGLHYVYVGNVLEEDGGTTFCPGCQRSLIRRQGYQVLENRLRDGRCPDCHQEIYGRWT